MPKRRCELRRRIRQRRRDKRPVRRFCRVVFYPFWCSLERRLGDVGDVGREIEDAVGDGIDGVDSEGGRSRGWSHRRADVGGLEGEVVGLGGVVAVGELELVDVCMSCDFHCQ